MKKDKNNPRKQLVIGYKPDFEPILNKANKKLLKLGKPMALYLREKIEELSKE